jgi:hypothetical protein
MSSWPGQLNELVLETLAILGGGNSSAGTAVLAQGKAPSFFDLDAKAAGKNSVYLAMLLLNALSGKK